MLEQQVKQHTKGLEGWGGTRLAEFDGVDWNAKPQSTLVTSHLGPAMAFVHDLDHINVAHIGDANERLLHFAVGEGHLCVVTCI